MAKRFSRGKRKSAKAKRLAGARQRRVEPDDIRAVAAPREDGPTPGNPRDMAELRVLHSVLDSMQVGLIVAGVDGAVVMTNPAVRQMLGEELDGMNLQAWTRLFTLHHADGVTPFSGREHPLRRALAGEAVSIEEACLVVTSSQRCFWVSLTARPILDEEGAVRGMFLVARDVTRRHMAEEQMRLHERAMASAFDGITIADALRPGYPIVYANAGFERMTGFTREEIMGREWAFLQCAETSRVNAAKVREAMREQRGCTVELLNCRKEGEPFWNLVSVMPVRDAAGRLTHYVGVQSDITRLKQTEDRLRAARNELQTTNHRMKQNLEAAAETQRALLPTSLPEFAWGSVAWRFLPCDELAGDILNVFVLDEDHIGLYVLDVCGHGVASALLSVTVRRFLSPTYSPASMVSHRMKSGGVTIVSPARVADQLNARFSWDADRGQFFTVVYGVLDTRTLELRYILAGHPPPLHLSARGRFSHLPGRGFPIGVSRNPYVENSILLEPGDRLLFYSDGLTDVLNGRLELFGEQRTLEALHAHRHESLDAAVDGLMVRIDEWRNGCSLKDDVTLLALEIDPNHAKGEARG